ncbi:hypothetical protein [Neisseria elongata]|uniref:hypothetical protein n=1 Tax=Neisseria elongata TaxID=495 RepID=UPI0036229DEF
MPAISLDMGMTGTGGLSWLNRVAGGRLTSLCAFLIFTSFASNIKSAVCPYWIKAGPMNLAELVFNHNGIAVSAYRSLSFFGSGWDVIFGGILSGRLRFF